MGSEPIVVDLTRTWYAKPNDVIGGWCVMDVDALPSSGAREVACFATLEEAEHIAALHNNWLAEARD